MRNIIESERIMIKIFTDTSTMYTPQEGAEKGFKVFPLSVSINNQTYQEFVDIDTPTFYEQVLKEVFLLLLSRRLACLWKPMMNVRMMKSFISVWQMVFPVLINQR